ncbi:MAG: hypothetical protein HC880_03005 [Bacteroidia bacterium]|nr:hypothetical protein [Bacteroidia bacterium]
MLVEFSLQNFLSFKGPVTLSLVGSNPVKEHEENEGYGGSNIFYDPTNNFKLLKSAVIYGANGSGKRNL